MAPAKLQFMQRYFPFLNWPRPGRSTWLPELSAGVTVGLMVIPQGVAYAALAGMPLVTGIYASMLPALVAVLWSASTRLSVGPTALTCLLVASSLTGMALPGSAEWINLAVWLALLSGLLQLLLGFIRFGWLLNVVSAPILMGFSQAAAVLILASQLPSMLGLAAGSALWAQTAFDAAAASYGIASLVLLLMAKRFVPRWPAVVLLVLGAAGISAWSGYEAAGGKVVGALASGLPALYVPAWPSWHLLSQLLVPTLVITLVSFLETASSAKVESQRGSQRWDQDQDLIGQGLAKICSGLCGAFPTSSSFSRSALNLYAGAQTGWATVVSVAVVLLTLLFFTPVLHHVPQAVLAAIVVAAIYGLLKPSAFVNLWKVSRVEALSSVITMLVTLAVAPHLYWGVIAGLLLSLCHFLYHRLHPRIIEVGLHADGSLRDRHLWRLPALAANVYALRMDDELDFASANAFERNILDYLAQHPGTQRVCLFAQPVNRIDATGVEVFMQLHSTLITRGIGLTISGIKLPVESVLRKAGALQEGPLLQMFRTDAETLAALQLAGEHIDPISDDAVGP